MPADIAPSSLHMTVVVGGLAVGLALGAVGQATRFCVRGAIADWVVFRGPGRLLSWLLAIAVGAVAVQGLITAGLLDASRTIYWGDRLLWLSALVGGVLFGYGMILAGGCPQRCLVKSGEGNLRTATTLVVVAIVSLMTLRGAFAPLRVNVLDAVNVSMGGSQDIGGVLGRALGVQATALRWTLAAAVLAAVLALGWRVRRQVQLPHWIGGIAVGLLLAAAFYLTGSVGFLAEHPETLEPAWLGTQSKRPEGLSFSAPLGHALDLLTFWSDKATVATFGVTLALGVLLGAIASAVLRGQFRFETFRSPAEMRDSVVGGVLMGFGGICALGCSIGNGVTGVAMQSAGAVIATAGISAGAWLALKRQMRSAEGTRAAIAAANT